MIQKQTWRRWSTLFFILPTMKAEVSLHRQLQLIPAVKGALKAGSIAALAAIMPKLPITATCDVRARVALAVLIIGIARNAKSIILRLRLALHMYALRWSRCSYLKMHRIRFDEAPRQPESPRDRLSRRLSSSDCRLPAITESE